MFCIGSLCVSSICLHMPTQCEEEVSAWVVGIAGAEWFHVEGTNIFHITGEVYGRAYFSAGCHLCIYVPMWHIYSYVLYIAIT